MKYLIFTLILPLALACKSPQETVEATPPPPPETPATQPGNSNDNDTDDSPVPNDSQTKPQKPYRVKATFGETGQKTDYYTILTADIEGTLLIMDIEYSGGCGWHKYEFIGSRGISKSLPPQRNVQLLHDNGDDQCEAIVKQTIEIDITDMAQSQKSGSEIILNLEGYDEPLKFVYP